MRSIVKAEEPAVLLTNKVTWTAEYAADPANKTKKYRYRHPDIKAALKTETSDKCVYCESKIGHNTPGDVEHKVPSSLDRTKHFEWENLTIACTECNRRKSAYYDVVKPFLDPYLGGVEARVVHHGPIVCWSPSDVVAETTVKILNLNDTSRTQLVARKVEHLDALNNVVARLKEADPLIQELMKLRIDDMKSAKAEFSGMVQAVCATYGI
ncbi:HNH endonuclease [Ensifer sp. D2-11]